ncbi:MAG: hypothetical protein ABSE93_00360 [Terriglobia bacterium]|jgi:hypothetical protein
MRPNTSLNSHAKVDPASDPSMNLGEPIDRVDLALAAILALGSLVLFWKVIFTPSMLFIRDVFNYTYPSTRFIQEMCRHGALPYWNPYMNYGQPLLENPNLLFFYPYTLFIILLPIDLAYPLHYVIHFALAGVGTFLLARRWGQSRQAAFFAGFVFAFSGPLLSLGNLYNHAACAAWMPWALLATDRAVQGRTARPWILLTLVFSLQFLAAEPFTLLATFGLCLAYALYLRGKWRPLMSASNLRILTGFVLAGCLMMALCAVQFLPSAELLSHSRRGAQGLRYGETSSWAFHPLLLMEMLVPDFYGPGLTSPTSWNAMVDDGNSPYFISVFTGFVPLFFALAGWALGQDRRRNFVAGSTLLILVLSFGHFTPVFSLAYLLVPVLTLVRYPAKLLVPVIMLVAILAGWGLDALRREPNQWKARRSRALFPLAILLACSLALWAAAGMAPKLITLPSQWALVSQGHASAEAGQMAQFLAAMLRLYIPGVAGFVLFGVLLLLGLGQNKVWARTGVPIFALLGLAQLIQVNYQANPTVPRVFFTYSPPVLSRFTDPPGSFRVDAQAPNATVTVNANDLQGFVNFESIPEVAGIPAIGQGDFQQKLVLRAGSMLEGVEGSLNLDMERSLPPFVYDECIYMLKQAPDTLHQDCLLGRTNVKYIVRSRRRDSSGSRILGEIFNGSPQPSYLYEDLYFVPRAYVAGTAIFTTSPLDTLRRMASPDFDALENVILAADPGTSPAVQGSGPAGRVEVTERQPNRVTLTAHLSRPGYVVLLDRYDSNWHAELDGRKAEVLRANQLFRTVYTPAGAHTLCFYYHQSGLLPGAVISALTCVLLASLYFFAPLEILPHRR